MARLILQLKGEGLLCVCVCVADVLPGQEDALVLLQLLHEGGVGLGDRAALLYVVESTLQVPAVLFHGIGDHRGGRTAHAHLAMDQALGSRFPKEGKARGTRVTIMFCKT